MKNARFWDFVNGGWCKVTLRPGQSMSWVRFGWTEEGSKCEAIEWEHDGEHVISRLTRDETDCDGRFSTRIDLACPVESLRSVELNEWQAAELPLGVLLPDWRKLSATQRDYSAEHAGY